MQIRMLIARILGFFLNIVAWFSSGLAGRLAIYLFTSAPRPRLREKEKAFLQTAERQQACVRYGREIREYHWGLSHSPIVILAYGWGYNTGRWRHFVPDLVKAGYRVIAYDPPGHGLAHPGQVNLLDNAAFIRELIEAYGRPAAILGHSFGGASAILALSDVPATLHPDRVVLMASFSDARGVFRVFRRALGLTARTYYSFLQQIEQITGRSVQDFDLARKAATFHTIQALLVHDREDEVTPYGESVRYHLYWPKSYLLATSGRGHHLGSAQITQAILQFLIHENIPSQATPPRTTLAAHHDLVRYFAGWEV